MKLAIISHTEHFKTNEGMIVGWSPTINEINHLLDVFDEIYHVAMLHEGEPSPSAMAYTSSRIKFIPLKPLGGRTLSSKFNTLLQAPHVIKTVVKTLKKVDYFQLRTPTGIGVYLIPYLTVFSKKKGWYKYAGNWNQENAPLGYRLQRFMLKNQSRKVTINGNWQNQPKHCYTFENPCLTINDLALNQKLMDLKGDLSRLSFCYVGRLEKEKGVERIIKAFSNLTKEQKQKIDKVHLVGNGFDFKYFKELAETSGVDIVFHGFLSRDKVFDVYKKTHFFLMPTTASEGFPKVIAEAMNFGCLPIVSNISSIGQYIVNEKNGFLLNTISNETVKNKIQETLLLSSKDYFKLINARLDVVNKFTFAHYNNRILKDII